MVCHILACCQSEHVVLLIDSSYAEGKRVIISLQNWFIEIGALHTLCRIRLFSMQHD